MRFSTLFFDLDETLYPPGNGLWGEIRQRINAYMLERLGLSQEQVDLAREQYFRDYGTTLRGLQANYSVDMADYLAFVHAVPLDRYLHPDPELRAVIAGVPGRKFIITNADSNHANRVLDALHLQGLFEGIFDVYTMAPYCKPMPEAFALALAAAGSPDPATCLLLDDQERITRAAHQMGFFSILVGQEGVTPDADATLKRLVDLPGLLGS